MRETSGSCSSALVTCSPERSHDKVFWINRFRLLVRFCKRSVAPRPACGERSDRIERCDPGEGDSPRVRTRGESPSPRPSPRKRGEGEGLDARLRDDGGGALVEQVEGNSAAEFAWAV